jgi:hypothetical protein
VTLICERPKIKPHRAAMRERLAEILDLPLDRVSVKATTTEGMGFTGRGEGLAAQAIAVVETPAYGRLGLPIGELGTHTHPPGRCQELAQVVV